MEPSDIIFLDVCPDCILPKIHTYLIIDHHMNAINTMTQLIDKINASSTYKLNITMNKEIYDRLVSIGFYEEILPIEDIDFLKKIAYLCKNFDYKDACHTNFKNDFSRNVPFKELEKLK